MTSKPVVLIVAALLPSLGIGNKGTMPWRLRREMKYFRTVTSKTFTNDGESLPARNAVIMGRKTWESIPPKFRPLPDRLNIVLSRLFEPQSRFAKNQTGETSQYEENVVLFNALQKAIDYAQKTKDIQRIYIIGGAEIYNQAVTSGVVSHILLTEIKTVVEDKQVEMDTFLDLPLYNGDSNHRWAKNTKQQLQEFVGKDVELPDDKGITEGDFKYDFTLWKRRE